jgi:uncharacterized protein (UPF0262 family)
LDKVLAHKGFGGASVAKSLDSCSSTQNTDNKRLVALFQRHERSLTQNVNAAGGPAALRACFDALNSSMRRLPN